MLIFSALISGSEVSFFSLSPADFQKLNLLHSKKAKDLLIFLNNPKRILATLLIVNNFINVSIIILAAYLNSKLFNFSQNPVMGFILQVVVVTFILLLFGEMVPKIYASKKALRFALFMIKPIEILINIFYPASSIMMLTSSFFDKRLKKKSTELSINELSYALELTTKEEESKDENKILKGIVRFGEIDVKEIMKPRMDVVSIEYKTGYRNVLKEIIVSGYSRIPVYQDNFDNVCGVLYIKDLLSHLEESDNFKWQNLLRDPYFVPESKKINILLKEFQTNKIHLSIVVDEYGGTSGIVTLEDIVEQIVGEISDEFDENEELLYIQIDDKNYLFDGKTNLNDFYRIMGIEEDIFDNIKGESDTIAGLLIEVEKEIPRRNKSITLKNYTFKVESVDRRRIKRVKVTINDN